MNNGNLKKLGFIFLILLGVGILSFTPSLVLGVLYYAIPNSYQESYLGELTSYYEKAKNTSTSKVMLIGGSNIAFGIDVNSMEKEIDEKVVPFGLYATLGTKLMLDLSLSVIKEGDDVIVAPEINPQAFSLYFNPEIVNQTIGGNFDLIHKLSWDNRKEVYYHANKYITDNLDIYTGKRKISLSGVYQKSSFDENCNMIFDKPGNIMPLKYDPSTVIEFSKDLLNREFIDYLNNYSNTVKSKGAKIYFSFSPCNILAVNNYSETTILDFYLSLKESLNFPVISNPLDYIMDSKYFYDTNFHLNNAGAAIRTNNIINDLMREKGIQHLSNIPIPEIIEGEVQPEDKDSEYYDNVHQHYFVYEDIDKDRCSISGVTSEGKDLEELHVPAFHNGKKVMLIKGGAFDGCDKLKKLCLYSSLSNIAKDGLSGATSLEGIYIYADADMIIVDNTGGLFTGVNPECKIYVFEKYYLNYCTNYFWGFYVDKIRSFNP